MQTGTTSSSSYTLGRKYSSAVTDADVDPDGPSAPEVGCGSLCMYLISVCFIGASLILVSIFFIYSSSHIIFNPPIVFLQEVVTQNGPLPHVMSSQSTTASSRKRYKKGSAVSMVCEVVDMEENVQEGKASTLPHLHPSCLSVYVFGYLLTRILSHIL